MEIDLPISSESEADFIELTLDNYLGITTNWFVAEGWPGKANAAQDISIHPHNVLQYLYDKIFTCSYAEWEAKLIEAGEDPALTCRFIDKTDLLDTSGATARYERIGFTRDLKRYRILVTHLAIAIDLSQFLWDRDTIYSTLPRENIDLSHLCHNPCCANTKHHLIWEPHAINMEHNKCAKNRFCSGDHFLTSPHQDQVGLLPVCIKSSHVCRCTSCNRTFSSQSSQYNEESF